MCLNYIKVEIFVWNYNRILNKKNNSYIKESLVLGKKWENVFKKLLIKYNII